jgi:hypothetical protein
MICGVGAEIMFAELRGDLILRRATTDENMNEHWDLLDAEFGKVDVKAPKRLYRGGPVDYTMWWELRTVNRPMPQAGWGIPNGVDRLIALSSPAGFHLVDPADIIHDLRVRCREYYRGEFGLYSRPNRGDLMTILPQWYVEKHQKYFLGANNDLEPVEENPST